MRHCLQGWGAQSKAAGTATDFNLLPCRSALFADLADSRNCDFFAISRESSPAASPVRSSALAAADGSDSADKAAAGVGLQVNITSCCICRFPKPSVIVHCLQPSLVPIELTHKSQVPLWRRC